MDWSQLLKSAAQAALPADVDSLDGFDSDLVEVLAPMLRRVLGGYFRATVAGVERIPAGPAMIVGNHNGGVTFLEPFLFGTEFYEQRGMGERLYFLGHDAIVRMPGLGQVLARGGAVRASPANGHKILDAGHKLVVYPGGNREAFRPFADRNRIDFCGHRGFAALALARDVPIVPMLSAGGHETFFVLKRGERLARLLQLDKLVRSKVCPIAIALPWGLSVGPIFHLPLPAKCSVELGEPIKPSEAVGALAPERRVDALYALVVGRLQAMMDAAAARRKLPVIG